MIDTITFISKKVMEKKIKPFRAFLIPVKNLSLCMRICYVYGLHVYAYNINMYNICIDNI